MPRERFLSQSYSHYCTALNLSVHLHIQSADLQIVQIPALGWSNPQYQYRLRDEGIESPAEKDLGVLVGKKLDKTH